MLLLLLIDKIVLPFIVVLPVLIATAYFTLAERKVLASVQSINKINKTKIFIRVNI
jgi:NADH:ubiquinone oxidoreductase subunit H